MATIYQNGIQYSGSGEPLVYDDMGGATSTTDGVHGLVPAPSAGDNEKFLSGDGSWKSIEEYVTKTASGNPIEISDGASAPLVKCVTEIQGSQDLHGYDKPWVGGAGKNKIDATTVWSASVASDGSIDYPSVNTKYYIPQTLVGQTLTFSAYVKAYANNSNCRVAVSIDGTITNGNLVNTTTEHTLTQVTFTPQSTSDYVVLANSGSNGNYKDIQLESGSTATTFAPYSNICPITAYTEGEIEVRGKNAVDISKLDSYDVTGRGVYRIGVPVSLKAGIYTLSRSGGSSILFITNVTDNYSYVEVNSYPYTFTLANDSDILVRIGGSSLSQWDTTDLQIEKGSTATDYESYTSTTHTTTYPSAIYRGSEDVVNGEVTSEMLVADMGDLTWSTYTTDTTGHSFYVNVPNGTKSVSSDSSVANIVCENYETVAFLNPSEWLRRNAIICQVPNAQRWIVRNERYSDATSFTSAMSGVKIAFELATPTTSSVTPTNAPIKSLSGYSHIESSTGDLEVEYIAKAFSPITELVDSQISALQKMMELMLTSARETTMTASANYTTGTLIVACGALYKATTAISSGASLVVGTNITPTTIAAELAALA